MIIAYFSCESCCFKGTSLKKKTEIRNKETYHVWCPYFPLQYSCILNLIFWNNFRNRNDFIQDCRPWQHQDNKPQPLSIRVDLWCDKIAKKIGVLQEEAEKRTGYQWHSRKGNKDSRSRDQGWEIRDYLPTQWSDCKTWVSLEIIVREVWVLRLGEIGSD